MIILENIQLRRGAKNLLEQASATLQPGQKIALIGANGCGKSSFFAMLLGQLTPDAGTIRGLEALRLAHMAQEVASTQAPARDYVAAGDRASFELLEAIAKAEQSGDYDRAATLHQALEHCDGYSLLRRAEQLLLGLGFSQAQCQRPVSDFSGGWRIRLNLGRALMTPSDLMLLDEPTNHLDLDATLWLQRWLASYPGTLVMISHDRDFIDATCERVMRIEHQRLGLYKGGYSDFERQRAEHMAQQQASFDKQQRRIAEIEDFVRRFRYKATKAKQAQSRLKELERMQQLAPAHIDSPFQFSFPAPGKSSDPLLILSEASVGYDDTTILSRINMSLRPGDRIGLLGKNGAGKTTLLKSLTGVLPLKSGERHEGAHLRIGYFDQQQLDVLDLEASALLHIQRLSPTVREQDILDFLGGFNFRGEMVKEAIAPFSGGEKARLALAMVVWQDPNLLVLDEPTNHLDLEMRHALEVALQGYSGALLLVSHDRHLLRNSVETLLLVDDGAVQEYDNDLAAYEQWILRGNSDARAPSDKAKTEDNGQSRKAQRQEAAERRTKLKPLRQALQKAERELDQAQAKLADLQNALSDPDLYQGERKEELAELVRQEGIAKSALANLEERWLELQEELEHNEALLAS